MMQKSFLGSFSNTIFQVEHRRSKERLRTCSNIIQRDDMKMQEYQDCRSFILRELIPVWWTLGLSFELRPGLDPELDIFALAEGEFGALALVGEVMEPPPPPPDLSIFPQPLTSRCLCCILLASRSWMIFIYVIDLTFNASFLLKLFSQLSQGNGFTARWILLCRFKSWFRLKLCGHWSHLKGRSCCGMPGCIIPG